MDAYTSKQLKERGVDGCNMVPGTIIYELLDHQYLIDPAMKKKKHYTLVPTGEITMKGRVYIVRKNED